MDFGERLKQAREEKGYTQQKLADKLYVTRQAVSKWECGTRYPDLLTTKCIADILDISIDKLLSDDMKDYSEKQVIVESKRGSCLITSLYSVIAILSFTKIVPEIFNVIFDRYMSGDLYYFSWQSLAIQIVSICASFIVGALCLFALYKAIRVEINSKMAGAIGLTYLIASVAKNLAVVDMAGISIEMYIFIGITLVFAILIGLYFIMGVSKLFWSVIACSVVATLYAIASFVVHIIAMMNYDAMYVIQHNDITGITVFLLKLSFVAIIVIQASELERKRKLCRA